MAEKEEVLDMSLLLLLCTAAGTDSDWFSCVFWTSSSYKQQRARV